MGLLDLSSSAKPVYELLATAFWPGPLTLIGKAVPEIPLKVTAGTVCQYESPYRVDCKRVIIRNHA